MSETETIIYICDKCGYRNVWTRDQIVQRGTVEVYRGGEVDEYIVPCKNPDLQPSCPGWRKLALPRKK